MKFSYRSMRQGGLCLLAAGIFACALLYACFLTLKLQKQSFETEARNTATIVRSAMDVVEGVATSLRALQSSKSDRSQSDSYAKTVINKYAVVNGFGRFEKLSNDQTAGFVNQHSHDSNLASFALWWYDENGNQTTSGVNTSDVVVSDPLAFYYPITLLNTHTSFAVEKASDSSAENNGHAGTLIGFDLGSLDVMRSAILHASVSGETTFVKVPKYWPRPNSILAIRSSYQGNELPGSIKDRRERLDGGYWLELDIAGLSQLDGSFEGMGLKLSLIDDVSEYSTSDLEAETLYYQSPEKSEYLFADWFATNEWLSTFSIGNQTITVLLSREKGLTIKSLLGSLAGTVFFLTLLGVIIYLNNKRRKAIKKQTVQSERLYLEQHRAAVTLASIGDAVLSVDIRNSVQYCNSAAEDLLDVCGEKIVGVSAGSVVRMVEGGFSDLLGEPFAVEAANRDEFVSSDQKLIKLDGTSLDVNLTISPLRDISGERSGSVIVLRDISAEKELTKRLEHQVNHDSLTGLANRYQFEKCLEQLFDDTSDERNHALCIIDLDRFKQINDTCGHAAGDLLLVQLAEALQSKIRAEDLLARLGGDEFGVIINNCDQRSANSVANRIHRFFKSYHFEYEDQVFPVRSSIGLVHFKPVDSTLAQVVCTADAACYTAKKNGRNSVHIQSVCDVSASASISEELWMPRIKDALEHSKFTLHAQPIAASAAIRGALPRHHEVFVRMIDDDHSLIYPVEFLKPAERYELMTQIDQWVIDNALRLIAQLPASMHNDIFSINLSASSVKDESLINNLQKALGLSGVKASQLCFEIDEDVALNNLESAIRLCRKLRSLGCMVALDDFGAGVSSLSALKELPVDLLKIDGQFVTDIVHSSLDESMVRSIHCFAESMGLATIAEKVESEAACQLLAEIGVDFIQGFVIARPAPLDRYFVDENQLAA